MQSRLSQAAYPNIDLADVGMVANIGYGSVPGVRAHAIVGGATALLTADITAAAVSFDIEDPSRFPTAPFTIQISYERMRVTNVTGSTFTVTRAYDGTTAAAHKKNKTVYEVLAEYVYLISEEPVKAIGGVFIDGRKQAGGFTAYTGQSGDEHASWPGKAVVAFVTDAILARQRGLGTDEAVSRETGETVAAAVEISSHPEIADGSDSSFITIGPAKYQTAQVAFADDSGTILRQEYSAVIENTGASESRVQAVVTDVATGGTIINRTLHIPATTKTTAVLSQKAGNWQTRLALVAGKDDIKVYELSKSVIRKALPGSGDPLVTHRAAAGYLSDGQVADGIASTVTIKPATRLDVWAHYGSTSLGDISSQVHYAKVTNPSGSSPAVVKLVSSDPDGTGSKITRHTIAASATETISHSHEGGAWDTMTRAIIETGELKVEELYKDVLYLTEEILSERSLEATATARVVIGDDVTVDAEWTPDDGSGTYTGTPGALIERPDHVIKHFLIERMGFASGDIDSASFSAAGTSYSSAISGGYRFAFALIEKITPSDFLRRMAFESRSAVKYSRGKWYLDFLPDAGPAAVATITKDELAGEGEMFVFNRTPLDRLANAIAGRYGRRYVRTRVDEEWSGTLKKTDAPSQSKYGVYEYEVDLETVRLEAMASDVLDHMLLQRKAPLLSVEFPVYWQRFNLQAGDTVDISNDLYNGKKFYIESIQREDRASAIVRAVEWWA